MFAIGCNPISIDKLSEVLGININEIQSTLFIMEMNGDIIKIDGGGLYQRAI
jgi:predicted Rossmann fold nucleotide-binding protein DprA/Smf involved in DNA uptake